MSRTIVAAAALVVLVATPLPYEPARLRAGGVPVLPAMALGGGEVFLEVSVDADGQVTAIAPLRSTPPFTDAVVRVVRAWRFAPAEEDVPPPADRSQAPRRRQPVASKVLVAAVVRAPALQGPTQGQAPTDVAAPSADVPFPAAVTGPSYPPSAFGGGVVLLEVRVDARGHEAGVTVVHSAPPFDDPALHAVRQWRFRPALVRGAPVSSLVYVIVGFPVPVGIP